MPHLSSIRILPYNQQSDHSYNVETVFPLQAEGMAAEFKCNLSVVYNVGRILPLFSHCAHIYMLLSSIGPEE